MPKTRTRVEVYPQSAIGFNDLGEGRKRLTIVPGPHQLIEIFQNTPRRFMTYDTGFRETLLIEIAPEVDLTPKRIEITTWRQAAFESAGMKVAYLSTTASGSVSLERGVGKRFFRAPETVWTGSVRMRFREPITDLYGEGELAVEWDF